MFSLTNTISKRKLAAFCRKNHIRRLLLFGSALRDQLQAESDIDLLAEFEQGYIPGLMRFAGMEIELTEMAGKKVDLRTPAELSRYFRDDVLSKAKVEYAA